MSWSQVNPSNFVQVPAPKSKYIPSRFVGPKSGGLQKKEAAHWATPNGSWTAPPVNGTRGQGGQGLLPIRFPHSAAAQRPPLGPGGAHSVPMAGRRDPRMSIQELLLQPAGQGSRIQQLLAIFAALGHLPTQMASPAGQQQQALAPYGMGDSGGYSDGSVRY